MLPIFCCRMQQKLLTVKIYYSMFKYFHASNFCCRMQQKLLTVKIYYSMFKYFHASNFCCRMQQKLLTVRISRSTVLPQFPLFCVVNFLSKNILCKQFSNKANCMVSFYTILMCAHTCTNIDSLWDQVA